MRNYPPRASIIERSSACPRRHGRPMTPRLRVIVPTYNHQAYLRQALDSVLMQQTTFEFDVVVIDDASTDGTTQIVHEYAANWPQKVRAVVLATNQCDNSALRAAFNS